MKKDLSSLKKYYDCDDIKYRGIRDNEIYSTKLHSIKLAKTITNQ